MFCPRCGQNLPEGSGFCIRCGLPMFKYQAENQRSIGGGTPNNNLLVGPQANPWTPGSRDQPQLGPGGHYYINGMPVDVLSEQGPTYQPLRPDEKKSFADEPARVEHGSSVLDSLHQQTMEEIEDDGAVPIQGMENPRKKRYKTQEDVEVDSEFSKFQDTEDPSVPLWPLRLVVSIFSLFVTGFLIVQTLGYHTFHMIARGTFDNIIGLEIVIVAAVNIVPGVCGFLSKKSRKICAVTAGFYIIVAVMSFLFFKKYSFMKITLVLAIIAAIVFILGAFNVGGTDETDGYQYRDGKNSRLRYQ